MGMYSPATPIWPRKSACIRRGASNFTTAGSTVDCWNTGSMKAAEEGRMTTHVRKSQSVSYTGKKNIKQKNEKRFYNATPMHNQSDQTYIDQTAGFVKNQLANAEAGHDWWHILRVWNNAKLLLTKEPADRLICELAALLHDIADSKFHDGDETIAPRITGEFLSGIGVDSNRVRHV